MSVTLHHGTCFLVSDDRGDFEAPEHGFYFEDVRCLDTLQLTVGGEHPIALSVTQPAPDRCTYWLTNPRLDNLGATRLSIRRERRIDEALRERIVIDCFNDEPVELEVSLAVGADFCDLYDAKKQSLVGRGQRQHARDVERETDGRRFVLSRTVAGNRNVTELALALPAKYDGGIARYSVRVSRDHGWTLDVEVVSCIEHGLAKRSTRALPRRDDESRRRGLERDACTVESDHALLAAAYARAAADMVTLRLKGEENIDGECAIAGGIPWYMALFGRDSLIASYQCILHDPALARGTLLALAHLQGRVCDPASEEQPGRILHEYRKHLRGSARRNIPKFPYYGTADATPLWLVTLGEYVRCTGDLGLAAELWPNVERALEWIERYGDCDGDGLVEYATPPDGFLANEGWKDSPDSIAFADGRLAEQPIALVEVQGYVADAYERVAALADQLRRGRPAALRDKAETMRRLIRERYWLDGRAFFAEALDGHKRPVDSLTSNPGHLLWSRAVDDAGAAAIARALFGDALFAGWGVRTMGKGERRYNPISYHDGSIWPHDNVLFLAGLARYGRRDDVARLAGALLGALAHDADARFPELFAGFGSDETPRPIAYPNANEPQAWASGAILLLVRALLGIDVDAAERRMTVRPAALDGLGCLVARNLAVGGQRVTLEVRWSGGRAHTRVDGLPADWRVDG